MSWFIKNLEELNVENSKIPKIFVETGSYLGNTIQDAIDSNFYTNIHSIEISPKWYNHCRKRFENKENVFLHIGNSADVLRYYDFGNEPVLFYLDAHFSGGETGGQNIENGCPLLLELKSICENRKNVNGDVLYIDDMRLMGKASWSGMEGCTVYPKTFFDFSHVTIDAILSILKSSFPQRKIKWGFCRQFDRMVVFL